ncbi:MAG TPA: hypothetical protein VHX12_09415 [Acidisoma sp.]|nr:hypothetical protein [Acidisoma sp.]
MLNEQVGAIGQAYLMRALLRGRIAYYSLLPETSSSGFKAFARATSRKPAIALIPDDDGFDRGPAGWRLAERALRWANGVLLHGAGAEIEHYEAAIQAAEMGRCVLVIECGTATLGGWAALVMAAPHRPSTLVIHPRGGVHPLPLRREAMQ